MLKPNLKVREDKKGELIELFRGKFAQANLLSMRKGSVWGGHYHKKTEEYFYIFRGEISVSFLNLRTESKRKKVYKKGESFIIKPYILHRVYVLKSTQCLVFYSKEFSEEEPDLYYLKKGE